jgi:predicted SAM-dependent methyltransferase
LKLQLGSGPHAATGWVNLDGSWNARIARHRRFARFLKLSHLAPKSLFDQPWSREIIPYDVRRPLPFNDATFSAVYASHLLEHLHLFEADRLLLECFRVLTPGGVLRLVVPDLLAIVSEYLEWRSRPEQRRAAGDRMNQRLMLRPGAPVSGHLLYRAYSAATDFHSHKWMYDADSLQQHMEAAGFTQVQEMGYRRSAIDGIEAVEQPERVLNGQGICVEGARPMKSA